MSAHLPSSLREQLASDYAQVTPLRSPFVRAAAVAPLALLVLAAAPLWFNVRVDAPRLGWLTLWGASVLQTLIGLLVVGAALRESVPGRSWSRGAIAVWIAIPIVIVVLVTMTSWQLSPIVLRREWWLVTAICFGCSLASALPVVALSSILAVRAYPTRPAVAGLLLGFGSGLMADAGWRIFCHFSEPGHVLSAHLAAVVAAALVGSAAASWLSARRIPAR
jgi:hypothetical protein